MSYISFVATPQLLYYRILLFVILAILLFPYLLVTFTGEQVLPLDTTIPLHIFSLIALVHGVLDLSSVYSSFRDPNVTKRFFENEDQSWYLKRYYADKWQAVFKERILPLTTLLGVALVVVGVLIQLLLLGILR